MVDRCTIPFDTPLRSEDHVAKPQKRSSRPASGRSDRGRWSSKRKTEAVLRLLRLLRGETLDDVSREMGVTASRLTGGVLLKKRDHAFRRRGIIGERVHPGSDPGQPPCRGVVGDGLRRHAQQGEDSQIEDGVHGGLGHEAALPPYGVPFLDT